MASAQNQLLAPIVAAKNLQDLQALDLALESRQWFAVQLLVQAGQYNTSMYKHIKYPCEECVYKVSLTKLGNCICKFCHKQEIGVYMVKCLRLGVCGVNTWDAWCLPRCMKANHVDMIK